MKSLNKILLSAAFTLICCAVTIAGNPDRQGEAGAAELLLNPWARSAGLHSMNTSSISGLESMRLNIAGLSRMEGREFAITNMRLYEGSDVRMNALGFGNKIGKNSSFGITLTSMDFGDIPVTTTLRPEGTGGTFSPSFFNFGLGYSYLYDNKISVGLLVRGVSESLSNVSAFGFAIDAGVQYVTGEDDNFRLGISLKNVGSPMTFGGQGLSFTTLSDDGSFTFVADQRGERFEMPSQLNIGVSYDFYLSQPKVAPIGQEVSDAPIGKESKEFILRVLGNFTSNAFSRDQVGVGAEVIYNRMFTLRVAYREEIGDTGFIEDNIYTGLSGGASVEIPFSQSGASRIGIDYAYRATNPFRGTHNFTMRLMF
jgi:hypothetical protein